MVGNGDECLVVDEKQRGADVCNNAPGNQAKNTDGDTPYGCYLKDYKDQGMAITSRAQVQLDNCVARLP
jgi:hypothetical protein